MIRPKHAGPLELVALLSAAWLVALWAAPARAERLETLFEAGNRAYFSGDYPAAAERYASLVEAGVEDADVYFNLATAHAKQGAYGHALWAFERSLALDPGRADAARGLAAVTKALGQRRANRRGEATIKDSPPLLEAMVRPTSENALAGATLAANFILFGLLGISLFARREVLRVSLLIGAALSAMVCLAAGTALLVKADAFGEGQRAVVLREDAVVLEGPDPGAGVRGTTFEGQRGRILKGEGSYRRVRLAGGLEGWMERTDISPI